MFGQLQNKFNKIFKTVKGHGKISEKNITDAIRQIRIALLESDVNFKVVSKFINNQDLPLIKKNPVLFWKGMCALLLLTQVVTLVYWLK